MEDSVLTEEGWVSPAVSEAAGVDDAATEDGPDEICSLKEASGCSPAADWSWDRGWASSLGEERVSGCRLESVAEIPVSTEGFSEGRFSAGTAGERNGGEERLVSSLGFEDVASGCATLCGPFGTCKLLLGGTESGMA